jgi:uncharacterized membrane protein YuzA (DUF378 family)
MAQRQQEDSGPGVVQLLSRVVNWVGFLASLVILGVFSDAMVHALVGKRTSLTVSLSLGISVTVSLVGVAAVIVVLLRSKMIRSNNTYLRNKVSELERENDGLRLQLPRHSVSQARVQPPNRARES